MKWLRKHRPAPGTAFGFAALMVALGGVAFAAIPDSNGIIHGCFKNNGNLRVVESAADCRNNENVLGWSQQGPQGPKGDTGVTGPQGREGTSGSNVVARARSTGDPVTLVDLAYGAPPSSASTIPMADATWTQAPGAIDRYFGQATITSPAPRGCPVFQSDYYSYAVLYLLVDGRLVGQANLAATGTGNYYTGNPDEVFSDSNGLTFTIRFYTSLYDFEQSAPVGHTLSVKAFDTCQNGTHYTVDSVKMDVVGTK